MRHVPQVLSACAGERTNRAALLHTLCWVFRIGYAALRIGHCKQKRSAPSDSSKRARQKADTGSCAADSLYIHCNRVAVSISRELLFLISRASLAWALGLSCVPPSPVVNYSVLSPTAKAAMFVANPHFCNSPGREGNPSQHGNAPGIDTRGPCNIKHPRLSFCGGD